MLLSLILVNAIPVQRFGCTLCLRGGQQETQQDPRPPAQAHKKTPLHPTESMIANKMTPFFKKKKTRTAD